MASRLDRSPIVWFIFGAILGPVALGLIWLAPPAWCRTCLMPARGMLRSCWWCGEPFHGSRARAMATAGGGVETRLGPAPQVDRGPHGASGLTSRAGADATADPTVAPEPDMTTAAHPTGDARAASTPAPTSTGAAQTPAPVTPPAPSDRVPVMDAPPRLRGRSRTTDGSATPGPGAPAASAQPPGAPPAVRTAVAERTYRPAILATAVYYSGTVRLELGSRYGFAIDDGVLRIVGPFSPSVVAYERPLAGVTVSVAHGRVLLSVPDNRAAELLVFTSVVGLSIDGMADAIQQAAQAAGGA